MTTLFQDREVLTLEHFADKMKNYPWANFEAFMAGAEKAFKEWQIWDAKERREIEAGLRGKEFQQMKIVETVKFKS